MINMMFYGHNKPKSGNSEVTYMTTEATTVNITVIALTDALYDWGDGSSETVVSGVVASHTYTDGLISHDIVITTSGLTQLACNHNSLTSLDVSNNVSLTQLACNYNSLTSLDVSNNVSLTKLFCYHNSLTSLDVSNNVGLTQLYCYNNSLASLDVSNNVSLTLLYCDYNSLTSLDVSNNASLTQLACNHNSLTSLDVSNNVGLTQLICNYNSLTSINTNTHLSLLVANGLSNGYYESKNQTQSAPPTGQGITDKTTLISRGWTVLTN